MQQQRNQQRNDLTRQAFEPPTFAGIAKNRIMDKHKMTEQEWIIYDAEISIGLLTLRTAFPTQTRNYSDREFDMLTALWLEVFAEAEHGILGEAILRFITADRKGFFPSPGQVMGIVEEVQAEQKAAADAERFRQHCEYLRQTQQRIDNGENCSTCRFCVCRKVTVPRERREEDKLFCQNPDSYKYEGKYGYGTVASIICDYYEPVNIKAIILIEHHNADK